MSYSILKIKLCYHILKTVFYLFCIQVTIVLEGNMSNEEGEFYF